MTGFVVGLDLGRYSERSALSIVEVSGERPWHYTCRRLKVWMPGTEPGSVLEDTRHLLRLVGEQGHKVAACIVHTTMVGDAVGRTFRLGLRGVTAKIVDARMQGLGERAVADRTEARVSRLELASTLVTLLNQGRLSVSDALPLAPNLQKEIEEYRLRPPTETDALARATDSDALVLATALACWVAEQPLYLSTGPLIAFVDLYGSRRKEY